jgi:myxalamid-type polyketide synthase MxaE and MxaD/epothilone polyketide synthase C/epothilone polyketide synthase D
VAVAQAPVLGLRRVVAMEHPELHSAGIDLDPKPSGGEIAALLAELVGDEDEQEIALREGERRVGRLVHQRPAAEGPIRLPSSEPAAIRKDGSYLVTGGLGGLGLSVAGWLAEQGAGHLLLVGRSGVQSEQQKQAVSALGAHGARVTVAQADVAVREELEKVLQLVAESGLPLRGVVHAAGLLDDGLLQQQSPERFRKVMGPKVQGALHLHELTRGMPLDLFVMYASGAGLLGAPGQGNYAAANTFLDALAHYRRRQGLPGLSIDWGAFSEVGLAVATRGARLVERGAGSMTPRQGLRALERLLASGSTQAAVMRLNVRQWAEYYPAAAGSRMLQELISEPSARAAQRTAGETALVEKLARADSEVRRTLLLEFLRGAASRVLRIPEGKLDVNAPLTSLGLDSLMGLELRNRIEAALGLRLPATVLWTYPTLERLSIHLVGFVIDAAASEVPARETPSSSHGDIATADEEGLFALLRAELDFLGRENV